MTLRSRRRLAALLLGALAALALLPHLRVQGSILDDAFITFRYAANLATGQGLVYNAGERVLGTTTPAWAVLLGGIGAVAGTERIPALARLLSGLFVVATGLLAWRAAFRLSGRPIASAAVAAPFFVAPHALFGGVAGMETPLFMLLAVTALSGVALDRWTQAVLCAGLSPLVRPEGVFLIAIVGVGWALHGRGRESRSLVRVGLGLLGPGALLAALLWIFYGSPWPHSIAAKRAGLYPFTVLDSLRAVRDGIAVVLPGGRALAALGGGAGLLFVLGAGSARLARGPWRLWPIVATLWVLLLFYGTSRTLLFPHYFALIEPWALLAWGAAAFWAVEALAASARIPLGKPALVASLLGALLLVPSALLYPAASVLSGKIDPADAVYPPSLHRMEVYRELAANLAPLLPEGTSVLLPEIGELGFRLPDVKVLDAGGLVSPEAIPHLPVPVADRGPPGVQAIPPSLVRSERPDLVISLELFARWGLYEAPWFSSMYDLVVLRWDPALTWGALRVHARRGWEGSEALRALPGGLPQENEPGQR